MPELELISLKLVDLKRRALICDIFEPFEMGPVWAHPKGLNTGFGAGHVEFIRIEQEIIDIAAQMDESYGRTRDEMDLFVAAMFELLIGKNRVMEQEFLSSP